MVGNRAKQNFWDLYKSQRVFKDYNPEKDSVSDPRFAYFQTCRQMNVQPRAGLLIKEKENPMIDFTN